LGLLVSDFSHYLLRGTSGGAIVKIEDLQAVIEHWGKRSPCKYG